MRKLGREKTGLEEPPKAVNEEQEAHLSLASGMFFSVLPILIRLRFQILNLDLIKRRSLRLLPNSSGLDVMV